jgi:hypothetical protein
MVVGRAGPGVQARARWPLNLRRRRHA